MTETAKNESKSADKPVEEKSAEAGSDTIKIEISIPDMKKAKEKLCALSGKVSSLARGAASSDSVKKLMEQEHVKKARDWADKKGGKSLYVKAGSGIVVLLLIVFLSSFSASAAKRADEILKATGLLKSIEYDDASYNPLTGVVTLKNIDLKGGPYDTQSFTMKIYKYKEHDGIITRFKVGFENIEVNLSKTLKDIHKNPYYAAPQLLSMATIGTGKLNPLTPIKLVAGNMPYSLLLLGYTQPSVTIIYDWSYNARSEDASFTASVSGKGMGVMEVTSKMENVPSEILKLFTNPGSAPLEMQQMQRSGAEAFGQMGLSSITMKYTEKGLLKKAREHVLRAAASDPDQMDMKALNFTDKDKVSLVKALEETGLSSKQAKNVAKQFASFIKNPKRFEVSIKARKGSIGIEDMYAIMLSRGGLASGKERLKDLVDSVDISVKG